jgi:hypothetical protein
MMIPSRSPAAIVEAIAVLAGDPERLAGLSAAGLAEASKRSLAAYHAGIAGSVKTLSREKDGLKMRGGQINE